MLINDCYYDQPTSICDSDFTETGLTLD